MVSTVMHPVLYPRRRTLDHSTPWGVEYPEYFLTICCRNMGTNQLCQNGVGERVLDLIRKYQETRRWHCSITVLMPDHLHAIVQIPKNQTLVFVIRNFKQACAKQAGVAWQRGFFEHRIRGNDSAQQKYRYIEMNPVRAGLVKRVEDWPWRIRFNDRSHEIPTSDSGRDDQTRVSEGWSSDGDLEVEGGTFPSGEQRSLLAPTKT